MLTNRLLILCLLALFMLVLSSCSKESDAEDIAEALADRLTDALDFEGGKVKEGDPPEGQSGTDAPQIERAAGDDLRLGAPYAFALESGFTQPENVDKAIVHVKDATKYIVVSGILASDLMELVGRLKDDAELSGEKFELNFALQTSDGITGQYKTLDVEVLDESAQDIETGDELAMLSVDGATPHSSGRPEANPGTDYPQITAIDGPATLGPGDAYTLELSTDYTGPVSAAILSTPNNASYMEIPASLDEGKVTITGKLSHSSLSPGDQFVFLLALKGKGGIGLYRSWTVTVVAGDFSEDGDEPVDGQDAACHILEGKDDDCDGTADVRCESYTFDDDGNMLTEQEDSDCDGIADEDCTIYTYDADNSLLTEQKDTDCNGTPDSCDAHNYDASGNKLTSDYDDDCDGTPDSCRASTYDANGNKLTYDYDHDCDGTPDSCITNTYDANGNNLTSQTDEDCNGTPDTCRTYTFDASGNKLTSDYDDDCDGTLDSCYAYTYDANGNRLTEQTDNDCDGSPDSVCGGFSWDINGNKMTEQWDCSCDGTLQDCESYSYDVNGDMLTFHVDMDCDGTPENCYTYTYDADGNRLNTQTDSSCNGTLNSCRPIIYFGDCNNAKIPTGGGPPC